MRIHLTFAKCPIFWVSKLQTEIALSTLHAEYVALSQSLHDLLPTKVLAKEVIKNLGFNDSKLRVITQSSVFEDNAGALQVAQSPRLTPTSKFIAVKYHWFRSHIKAISNSSQPIQILKIDGKVNPADIFTKSKSREKEFQALHFLLCGW